MPLGLFAMRLSPWFGLIFIVCFILSILYTIDYFGELKALKKPSKTQKIILSFLFIPHLLISLFAITFGCVIFGWVLYNNFIERQPDYTGGFLTFGVAPGFIILGITNIVSYFKKH